MSVRSSILAVLTLGPAYGLQLHAEIEARSARVGRINVGQIYSTLTRLVDAGLVVSAPRADDALPLYELTEGGRREASAWVCSLCSAAPSWGEMVEQVLLAASLPGVPLDPLLEGYRAFWAGVQGREGAPSGEGASSAEAVSATAGATALAAADRLLAEAALAWLDEVHIERSTGRFPSIPLSTTRPKRGRRPSLRS